MTTRSAASRNRRWFILILTFLLFFGVVYGDGGSLGSSPPDKGDDALFDKAFQPSMGVIVMVLISGLFFIGFFSIYLRHCATELGSNTPASPRFGFSLRPAQRGMEPAVIESLPTFVYSAVKGMKIGKGGTECAVCLSEFDDGDTIRLLPKCSHAFHTDCIDVWLSSHVTCPLCRANLLETVPSGGDARVVAIDIVESHLANDSGNQVMIPVADEEADPISRILSLHVPAASTSLRFPAKGRVKSMRKFPRSHSTGHSIIPVESLERFTIKLPENLQRRLLAGRMQPVDGGGSRSGRKASEGSSQWTFSITPPFIQRSVSSIPSRSVESKRV